MYLDSLPEAQISEIMTELEAILNPLSRTLASVPIEDQALIDEEEREVPEAREWLKHNAAIPMGDVLAQFGMTLPT